MNSTGGRAIKATRHHDSLLAVRNQIDTSSIAQTQVISIEGRPCNSCGESPSNRGGVFPVGERSNCFGLAKEAAGPRGGWRRTYVLPGGDPYLTRISVVRDGAAAAK